MPAAVLSTVCVLTHRILSTNDEVGAIVISSLEMGHRLTGIHIQAIWLPWLSPPDTPLSPSRGSSRMKGEPGSEGFAQAGQLVHSGSSSTGLPVL